MDDVRTVLLGQFTEEHAHAIVSRLGGAGIVGWVKRSGGVARVLFAGDWGVRVFVDADRREEAAAIAADVLGTPGAQDPSAGP